MTPLSEDMFSLRETLVYCCRSAMEYSCTEGLDQKLWFRLGDPLRPWWQLTLQQMIEDSLLED